MGTDPAALFCAKNVVVSCVRLSIVKNKTEVVKYEIYKKSSI